MSSRTLAILLVAHAAAGCEADPSHEARLPVVPPDFPDVSAPDDNALTIERVKLGKRLFYDRRLSRTQEVSCASCHVQEHAFADPDKTSLGVRGQRGTRNAPALFNMAWNTSFFWHGGAPTLELQALDPIRNPVEMDMTLAEVAERLAADPEVAAEFSVAYQAPPSEFTIPRALASFVRSLVSGNSRYDRWKRGEVGALGSAERRGMAIFNGERGECFHCHVGFNFTNNAFRNNGALPEDPDIGRARLTLMDADIGKFKVPSLRNVAVSAPYMHDGGLPTLRAVIEAYDHGGRGHANTDPTIHALDLTAQEKSDLEAFLRALTDEGFLRDPALRP